MAAFSCLLAKEKLFVFGNSFLMASKNFSIFFLLSIPLDVSLAKQNRNKAHEPMSVGPAVEMLRQDSTHEFEANLSEK